MNLDPPAGQPQWMFDRFRKIVRALQGPQDRPFRLAAYSAATLPDAAEWPAGLIYVTNESGGAVPAFSDGANWRRVTDRAVVS